MSDQPSKLAIVAPAFAAALAVGGIASQAYSHAACIDHTDVATLSLQSVEAEGEPDPDDDPESRDYEMYVEAIDDEPNRIAVRALRNRSERFVQVLEIESEE
jgi:hypothetical protein